MRPIQNKTFSDPVKSFIFVGHNNSEFPRSA